MPALFYYFLWFVIMVVVAYVITRFVVKMHHDTIPHINHDIIKSVDELYNKTSSLNDDLSELHYKHKILATEVDKINKKTEYLHQCFIEKDNKQEEK